MQPMRIAPLLALLLVLPACGGPDDDDSADQPRSRLEGSFPIDEQATFVAGPEVDGRAGAALAAIGDVDGDGFDDVLVGAPGTADDAGAVLLLRGSATEPLLGPRVSGPAAGARFGAAVAGVGDIDGDGLPDVLVGAPGAGLIDDQQGDASTGLAQGAAYLLTGPWTSDRTAAEARAILLGEPLDCAGVAVARVPDVDGDGVRDLVVSASCRGSYRAFHEHVQAWMLFDGPGGAYVVSGSVQGEHALADVALAHLQGEELWERAGRAVAGLPDTDGDGAGEVVIGAPDYFGAIWINPEATARVYVASGSARGDVSLADDALARLSGGCCGAEIHDELGASLAATPDGRLMVGAPGLDDFGIQGGAFLLSRGLTGAVDPWDQGSVVVGPRQDNVSARAGEAVAAGFDLDCDGVQDVALGAPDELVTGPRAGAVRVAYGPPAAWVELDGQGLHLFGEGSEEAGTAVVGADLDGDGCDALIVGAPASSRAATYAGGVWVLETPRD